MRTHPVVFEDDEMSRSDGEPGRFLLLREGGFRREAEVPLMDPLRPLFDSDEDHRSRFGIVGRDSTRRVGESHPWGSGRKTRRIRRRRRVPLSSFGLPSTRRG